MKASIIIPVFNTAQYLSQCVESVLRQNYADLEIILVDDGSIDKSPELCDKWAIMDQRIQVIHQSNRGLSAARNVALEHVHGDIIFFLDSDDYWRDGDGLKSIIEIFERTECDVVEFGFCKFWDGSSKSLHSSHLDAYATWNSEEEKNDKLTQLVCQGAVTACAWNKAIHRRLFNNQKLRFREGVIAEDIDWTVRLMLTVQSFVCVDKSIVAYRKRETSITGDMSASKYSQLLDNLRYIHERWGSIPYVSYFMSISVCNAVLALRLLPMRSWSFFQKRISSLSLYLKYGATRRVRMVSTTMNIVGLSVTCLLCRVISMTR